MGIDAYLSITGLVWCAFFSLLMIGIVFFIKNKTMKNRESNTKIFIMLYVITVLLCFLELFMQAFVFKDNPKTIIPYVIFKLYIALGMMWNFTIMIYYAILARRNSDKKLDSKFYKKVNTFYLMVIMIVLTLVITLPIGYQRHEIGFWKLNGPLNLVYNRMFKILYLRR